MRNKFDEQLQRLHVELIQMGATCEDAISAAAEALLKGDESLVPAALEAERDLDRREREVENLCLKLLLQQQPVAVKGFGFCIYQLLVRSSCRTALTFSLFGFHRISSSIMAHSR